MREGRERERETEGQEEGEGEGEREAYVIWGMWSCRNSGKTVQPLSFPEWLFGARHCAICFLCSITWTTLSSSCGFLYFKDEGLDLRREHWLLSEWETDKVLTKFCFHCSKTLSFSSVGLFPKHPQRLTLPRRITYDISERNVWSLQPNPPTLQMGGQGNLMSLMHTEQGPTLGKKPSLTPSLPL